MRLIEAGKGGGGGGGGAGVVSGSHKGELLRLRNQNQTLLSL